MENVREPGTVARLGALQTAHQHADSKAGILAAAQAALAGTSGTWAGDLAEIWRDGGPAAWTAGGLLALFTIALLGAAVCVALALLPRLWQPDTSSPYSFTRPGPATGDNGDEQAIDFLSGVAVHKYRLTAGAVLGTVTMGLCAGLAVLLLPLLAG
ncbi:hypothetical protein [Streptomyces sp. NPDC048425]|uniref:hypothetical protein n=1 Tax=Streptomyces sp. NPDC048425 TaxID=3365548 RepID=UPI0037180242